MVFGGTCSAPVILRLPGTLAAALGDSRLVVLFWMLGGLYALLGAMAVAELAAMMPEAGGFYVAYSRRAFGRGVGFVVGWADLGQSDGGDCLRRTDRIGFFSASPLAGMTAAAQKPVAIGVIALFTAAFALERIENQQHAHTHHQLGGGHHAAGDCRRLLSVPLRSPRQPCRRRQPRQPLYRCYPWRHAGRGCDRAASGVLDL